MPRAIVALPAHTDLTSPGRARWLAQSESLGDISALAGGTPRFLVDLLISGELDRVRLAVSGADDTEQGDGQDLSDAWERYAAAVRIQVPGLDDLLIQGPNGPGVAMKDTSERYVWGVGANGTTYEGGVAAWLAAYVDAYGGDNSLRATLVLYDGQGVHLAGRAAAGAPRVRGSLVVVTAAEPPATPYRTADGDVLDAVCWRHYGREDAVPAVLAANPGLADAGPVLPAGLVIELPDLPAPTVRGVVRLWGREGA